MMDNEYSNLLDVTRKLRRLVEDTSAIPEIMETMSEVLQHQRSLHCQIELQGPKYIRENKNLAREIATLNEEIIERARHHQRNITENLGQLQQSRKAMYRYQQVIEEQKQLDQRI